MFGTSCQTEAPKPVPPARAASLFDGAVPGGPVVDAPQGAPTHIAAASPTARRLQFADASATWGIDIRHHAGRSADKAMPEIITGGIALVDVDRNGALDIVLADGGGLRGLGSESASSPVGPRLLLGDGKGGFEDATQRWGLTAHGYGMGIAAGDVNNDGWVDLYLTTYDGKDRLLLNSGAAGTGFLDVTTAWALDPSGWSTSAAFLDMDNDGDLDLYVARYVHFDLTDPIKCRYRSIHVYCTPSMYEASTDRLFRNEGQRFTEVSVESGIAAVSTKSLALATGDLDDDGDTDLYIAGDTSQNLLWRNDGTGHFAEVGITAGVGLSRVGREEASMGVAVGDSDADGRWDLAVTNFQAEPTSLYALGERGRYRERSDAAGIGASARARLSFGIDWIDADNDGDEDLLVANGHISDNVSTYRETVAFAQLNSLYERVGNGRFVNVSADAGPALLHRGVSRGLAVGDLDADGGVDYLIVNNDGPVQVARNVTAGRGHFISLWLEGSTSNRSAIGAQVTVRIGGQTLRREIRGGSSFLSVSDRRVHLGLGELTQVEQITIRWPGGAEQELGPQRADVHLHVVEGSAATTYVPGALVLAP